MTGSRVTGEPGGGSHAARGGGGVFSVVFSSIEAIFVTLTTSRSRARWQAVSMGPGPVAAHQPE